MKTRIKYGCRRTLRFFEMISPMTSIEAIALYPFILFRDEQEDVPRLTVLHEEMHFMQVRRDGFFRFYWRYLRYNRKYGYNNNPYEVEARALALRQELILMLQEGEL